MKINGALEKAVVTQAHTVVCVTEQHTKLLRTRYADLGSDKFVTIPNGYDEDEWKDVGTDPIHQAAVTEQDKFVISYAGWLYLERNPEPLFRALRDLIDRGEMDGSRLQINLIGWCEPTHREKLIAAAARLGLDKQVNIEGPLMKAETFQRISRASLLLLLAEDWRIRVPAKAYEYLRAGRPILALAPPDGAIADLFRRTGGAWVVDHRDGPGITQAVREAYQDWRRGAPPRTPAPAIVAEFDRARLASRFATVLDRATR
jgi:glycosyltransferase involved in cell wall biosynthesis